MHKWTEEETWNGRKRWMCIFVTVLNVPLFGLVGITLTPDVVIQEERRGAESGGIQTLQDFTGFSPIKPDNSSRRAIDSKVCWTTGWQTLWGNVTDTRRTLEVAAVATVRKQHVSSSWLLTFVWKNSTTHSRPKICVFKNVKKKTKQENRRLLYTAVLMS